MKQNRQLIISLPAGLSELPVRIVRTPDEEGIVFHILPKDMETVQVENTKKKYAFVWHQNDYTKVALDEILWIEADRSYSVLHLSGGRDMTVSFNLATVCNELPESDFVQIHRSYIINIKHIGSMMGNSLKIGNTWMSIGRKYRDTFLDRFIFIGVRKHKKQKS